MNYFKLWKICTKNKYFFTAILACVAVSFYRPIMVSIRGIRSLNNFPLNQLCEAINNCCFFWFVSMLFLSLVMSYEVAQRRQEGMLFHIYDSVYMSILKFGVINSLICSSFTIIIKIILFAVWGKGHTYFLFRTIADSVVYFFACGVLAALIGAVLSFISHVWLSLFLSIVFLIIINTRLEEYTGVVLNKVRRLFELMPQNEGYFPFFHTGYHAGLFQIGLYMLWTGLMLSLLLLLIKGRKIILGTAGTFLIMIGIMIITIPGVNRNSNNASLRSENSIFSRLSDYKAVDLNNDINNSEALENAGFDVTEYKLDFSTGFSFRATAEMTINNKTAGDFVFTLYHKFNVDHIKDDRGNELSFKKSGDILHITPSGDIHKIVISYHGAAAPLFSDLEGAFLDAGFPWYPYPGEQSIMGLDEDNIRTFYHCVNAPAEYSIRIKAPYKVFVNLPYVDGYYKGQTTTLMLTGGPYDEKVIDTIHYIYPVELDYYYDYKNGIDDWCRAAKNILDQAENPDEIKYIFYGISNRFPSGKEFKKYFMSGNLFVYDYTDS